MTDKLSKTVVLVVSDEVCPIGSIFNAWLKRHPNRAEKMDAFFEKDHFGRNFVSIGNSHRVVFLGDVFAVLRSNEVDISVLSLNEGGSSEKFKDPAFEVVEFFNKFGKAMKFVKRITKAEKARTAKAVHSANIDAENSEIDEMEVSDKSEEVRKAEKQRKLNSDRRKKSKIRKDARKNAGFTEFPDKVGDVEKAA